MIVLVKGAGESALTAATAAQQQNRGGDTRRGLVDAHQPCARSRAIVCVTNNACTHPTPRNDGLSERPDGPLVWHVIISEIISVVSVKCEGAVSVEVRGHVCVVGAVVWQCVVVAVG